MLWRELRERGSRTIPLSHLLALPVFPVVQKLCMIFSSNRQMWWAISEYKIYFPKPVLYTVIVMFLWPDDSLTELWIMLTVSRAGVIPIWLLFGTQDRENNLKSIRNRQRAFASSVLRTVNKPRFEGNHPFNLRWMFAITITGFHYYLTYSKYILLGEGDFLKTIAVQNVLI